MTGQLGHVTLVKVHVKQDCLDGFIAATEQNHLNSVQEPGNLRFDVLQDPEDPTRFVLYEVYKAEADAKSHKETPHYLTWRDTVADMMVSPREGVPMIGLFP